MIRLAQAWRRRDGVLFPILQTTFSGLMRSSAVYALATIVSPLTAVFLAPFLTRYLDRSDYGLLAVLNVSIALAGGVTQLGLGSAFFRAYNYDYSSGQDRNSVLTTTFGLLLPGAVFTVTAAVLALGVLPMVGSKQTHSGKLIVLAAIVVILQNLSVPGFAWMRADGRAGTFAFISIINLSVTVSANILLVGVLHLGVVGSLAATGSGYGAVILATVPILLRHLALPRLDIALTMLSFGVPQVPNVLAMWVLQLSDRYLLAQLRSLDETARYAVAYSLGMAVSIAVVSPFALAWPTTMYSIAKRSDAKEQFRVVFTLAYLLFLFSAFALSILGAVLLYRLFSSQYHSAALVIPLVSESMAIYGMYIMLTLGIALKRKTWMASALTLLAAVANVIFNLLLIPHLGALGAATSTLLAFSVLAVAAYLVNQRLYPIDLPVVHFAAAITIGIFLYAGTYEIGLLTAPAWALPIQILGLLVYGACLVGLGVSIILPAESRSRVSRRGESASDPSG